MKLGALITSTNSLDKSDSLMSALIRPGTKFVSMLRISFRRTARALSSSAADAAAATLTHEELRATVRSFVALEVNPYVDEWEHEGIFPARQLFKKMGDAGLLGLTKPVEYGGLGLPFSYSLVMAEETGGIRCGGVPMAIGVQTDMATPALARFGSDELRRASSRPRSPATSSRAWA